EVLHTTGSDNLQEVLGEVFGTDVAAQMVPIEQDDRQQREDLPNIQVSGYVGLPGLNRSNRNQITLFVNGRWIQDQSLAYAVIQAYHTMLMVGRYPVAVIMVSLPPEEVDVNVHPAKAEVRFREPDAVFSAVQRTVRRTLIEKAPPQAVRQEISWGNPEWAVRRERLSQVTSERLKQLNIDMPIEGPGQHRKQYETDYSRPEAEENTRPVRTLPMLRVVGQIGATYIVTEGPTGMYLIDQHAAHERVLYEQFMAETSGKHQHSQELLEAVVIELSAEQMLLIEDSLDLLINAGFRVEPFGRNAVQVRALPMIIAHEEPGEALLAAIGEIECGSMPVEATAEEQLIARVCKRAAIKAGQVLSLPEMEALVRHLEQCQSPQTCPHGRPTMLHLSADQLAREFGRLGAI
nr:DNA mismatch repair protein MutL [Anaerolineae bacterium]